jgi:hypothetical protein
MKKVYNKIWELAKPYYLKARPMDIEHIEWMMPEALVLAEQENLDDDLLVPLAILHDVGYAGITTNSMKLETRKAHMAIGANIAKEILEQVNYPQEKIDKIVYYVSVHDNWAFGDFKVYENPILGVFGDLDFIWALTEKGFPAFVKIYGKSIQETIYYLDQSNENTKGAPFTFESTQNLYEKELNRLKEKYN